MDRCGQWRLHGGTAGMGRLLRTDIPCDTTVVIVGSCASSMEVARYLSENGVLDKWGAVIAVEQTQGRGQLRRPWTSPPGNLHVSAILPAAPVTGNWVNEYGGLLSLLCGYLFATVLRETGAQIEVKWPNDLLLSGRKVGGMLIESRKGVDILGMGINLAESPSDELMREDSSVSAGVLRTSLSLPGPLALWEALVNHSKSLYVVLLGELKPSQFVSALSGLLAWRGMSVVVNEREDVSYQAEIIGISPEGGLVVRHAEGEEVLFSGSIAPR